MTVFCFSNRRLEERKIARYLKTSVVLVMVACFFVFSATAYAQNYETIDISKLYNVNHVHAFHKTENVGLMGAIGFDSWLDGPVELFGIPFVVGPNDARQRNIVVTTAPGTQTITVPINKKVSKVFFLATSGWTQVDPLGDDLYSLEAYGTSICSVELVYDDGTTEELLPIDYSSGLKRMLPWWRDLAVDYNRTVEIPSKFLQVGNTGAFFVFVVDADSSKTLKEFRLKDNDPGLPDTAGNERDGLALVLASVTVELP